MLERSLKEENINYRRIEFSSGRSMKKCLENGLGITLCPKMAVREELEKGKLVQLITEDIVSETPVLMIWHIDKWCSPILKYLISQIKNHIH